MKQRASVAVFAAIATLLTVVAPVWAEDQYLPETLEISRKLQCPVCAGQSVADSNSGLAIQMRGIVEAKVRAGESEEQILDYFVAGYGESILADRPKSGFSLTLWWAPVLVLFAGALVVGLYLRERTARVAQGSAEVEVDDELEAIARDVLRGGSTQTSERAMRR